MDIFNAEMYHAFRLNDPNFYESFDQAPVDPEFLQLVRSILPPSWNASRRGVWQHWQPKKNPEVEQGFKIHVSSTPDNFDQTLSIVATICFQHDASFKHAADSRIARLFCWKGWSRSQAGKFITIFPNDIDACRSLMERLSRELHSLKGPYVLTDRRFGDSQVVSYRYGGFKPLTSVGINGEPRLMMSSPDGMLVADAREPYWDLPFWVDDPFDESDGDMSLEDDSDEMSLADGRYLIDRALSFSVSGGVYMAVDRDTGSAVVIKEARPHLAWDSAGQDATKRLFKEYEILTLLEESGHTPSPVEYFESWEHQFIAEEYIDGYHLGRFTITVNPLFSRRPSISQKLAYRSELVSIWAQMASAIGSLHRCGVVCGDISLLNFMISNDDGRHIKLIDLEGAWRVGIDEDPGIYTPGNESESRRLLGVGGFSEDIYSLGTVFISTLFPVTSMFSCNPGSRFKILEVFGRELGLPEELHSLVASCVSERPEERPTVDRIIEVLESFDADRLIEIDECPVSSSQPVPINYATIVDEIADTILSSASTDRKDRLFPADPQLFSTNPLSIAYGASGVIHSIIEAGREVPTDVRSWFLQQPFSSDTLPPGLYLGQAGVAWAANDMGYTSVAEQILAEATKHPLLYTDPSVYFGAAGVGLGCLKLFSRTKDEKWLNEATSIVEWLELTKQDSENKPGCFWPNSNQEIHLGYALGGTGIAGFLLYVFATTGEKRMLELGRQALDFDLSFLVDTPNGDKSVPRGVVGNFENVGSPYWFNGSAGIAGVLARYYHVTGDEFYKNEMDIMLDGCRHQHSVAPGLFQGAASLGMAMLDAYEVTGQSEYLDSAASIAEGASHFIVKSETGTWVHGQQLLRYSCDYSTGGAGILTFLHRLETTQPHVLDNHDIGLDGILSSSRIHLSSKV